MCDVLYRIMDANFNRAREALRVMEEYCRFGLNHPALSAQAKQCRHRLCRAMKGIDPQKLLACRNTAGDVGRELQVENQLRRQSPEDCFTAAAKRATEALRALAESSQAANPDIAAEAEKIRFEVYDLEKKSVLYSAAKHKLETVRLYVLINTGPQTSRQDILSLAKICMDSGADCLQLRAKNISDGPLLELAQEFTAQCKNSGIVSIINDRVDIAVLSEADGVHLGQNEIPVSAARQIAKGPLIVGVSTHDLNELNAAIDAGCDYAAIGPAFASPTKPNLTISGLDYINQAVPILRQAGIFHVAIGGINSQNVTALLNAGVRAVAVSSAITEPENPAIPCNTLKNILLNAER